MLTHLKEHLNSANMKQFYSKCNDITKKIQEDKSPLM